MNLNAEIAKMLEAIESGQRIEQRAAAIHAALQHAKKSDDDRDWLDYVKLVRRERLVLAVEEEAAIELVEEMEQELPPPAPATLADALRKCHHGVNRADCIWCYRR